MGRPRGLQRAHHPYTEALLSAVPTLEEPPRSGSGSKARSRAPRAPQRCVFHTRCPRHLGEICDTTEPPLAEAEPGHPIRCHIPIEECARSRRRRRRCRAPTEDLASIGRRARRRRLRRRRRRDHGCGRWCSVSPVFRSPWRPSAGAAASRRGPGPGRGRRVCHSDVHLADGGSSASSLADGARPRGRGHRRERRRGVRTGAGVHVASASSSCGDCARAAPGAERCARRGRRRRGMLMDGTSRLRDGPRRSPPARADGRMLRASTLSCPQPEPCHFQSRSRCGRQHCSAAASSPRSAPSTRARVRIGSRRLCDRVRRRRTAGGSRRSNWPERRRSSLSTAMLTSSSALLRRGATHTTISTSSRRLRKEVL